jgi:hypothetical protein
MLINVLSFSWCSIRSTGTGSLEDLNKSNVEEWRPLSISAEAVVGKHLAKCKSFQIRGVLFFETSRLKKSVDFW